MKILFLRFSSIGDIVLTTPSIRAAKEQIENAEIHFATKKQYQGILEENPYIDRLFKLEDSLQSLIEQLQKENYDLIIDLHNNLRTLRIKKALKKPSRSFKKLNTQKWLMVNFKADRLPNIHIVDRYMATLQNLGVKNDGKGLDFFISERDKISREELDSSLKNGYYVLAIGAQHFTKILPVHKMVEICEHSRKPVVLLGDKRDIDRADKIIDGLSAERKDQVVNLAGKLPLGKSAEYIRHSDGVYAHDSGLMHIAAAFKKPIISYWGNTIPKFGMYPYKVPHKIIENNTISCRPCTKIGYDKCPKGHFKCMEDLKVKVDFPKD